MAAGAAAAQEAAALPNAAHVLDIAVSSRLAADCVACVTLSLYLFLCLSVSLSLCLSLCLSFGLDRGRVRTLRSAGSNARCDRVDLVYRVLVLETAPAWTAVPLLPATVALASSEVVEEGADVAAGAECAAFVGMWQGRPALLAQGAGLYRVSVSAMCPYATKAKNGFRLHDLPATSQ